MAACTWLNHADGCVNADRGCSPRAYPGAYLGSSPSPATARLSYLNRLAAIDEHTPIATLLLKCQLLAARINHDEFATWVDLELNGYARGAKLPDYRAGARTCRRHVQRLRRQQIDWRHDLDGPDRARRPRHPLQHRPPSARRRSRRTSTPPKASATPSPQSEHPEPPSSPAPRKA